MTATSESCAGWQCHDWEYSALADEGHPPPRQREVCSGTDPFGSAHARRDEVSRFSRLRQPGERSPR
jgi:hypothetical protein